MKKFILVFLFLTVYSKIGKPTRASVINDQFLELLKEFNLSGIIINLLRIIIKKQFDSDHKTHAIEQHQITKNLEHLFNRTIKAKELFLKGEIEDDDFNVIKSDCEAKINVMGENLQHIALDIMHTGNDIDEIASQCLHMDRLFWEFTFEKKVKIIRLILKDEIVPSDKTFQNALNDTASVIVGRKFGEGEKCPTNPEPLIRSKYDVEIEYLYTELVKEAGFNTIKMSSMFWQKFPQIITFLKEISNLLNLRDTHE